MPSGHTTESFGAALSAVFGLKRWWLTPLLGCYAAATAFSRVYFSNHDSLDLLMGWLLGSYVAFGAAFLADVRWRNIFRASTWT
jgi:undecaprenyl-diphosphatase